MSGRTFYLFAFISITFTCIATSSVAAPASSPMEFQSFDSELLAEQAGWTGLNNEGPPDSPVDIGYSPTNFSAGASGAGEAGGSAIFPDGVDSFNYYADTTFAPNGSATLAGSIDEIHASGRFYSGDFEFDDDEGSLFYIGHFNTNDIDALNPTHIGLAISLNPNDPTEALVYLSFASPNGIGSTPVHLPINTPYRFEYDWIPSDDNPLTMRLLQEDGTLISEVDFNGHPVKQILHPAEFDAFGMRVRSHRWQSYNRRSSIYFDDVEYTVVAVPEPTAGVTMWIALASLCAIPRRGR